MSGNVVQSTIPGLILINRNLIVLKEEYTTPIV